MSTSRQVLRASGYLSVLIAPALLTCAALINRPFLVVGSVLLVFPLARLVFGAIGEAGSPSWDERVATALDHLAKAYAATLASALLLMLETLSHAVPTLADSLGWTLSLWATLVFTACVAHDLLHRARRRDRLLGHLLAGVAGYPMLGYEHRRHHCLPGSTASAEWPRITESVWRFAWRRLGLILRDCLGPNGAATAGSWHAPAIAGLRIGLIATTLTLALFAWTAGWTGALIYSATSGLIAFSMQLVTYLQHWGLGDDNLPDARERDYSWESDCRFQMWVTLGLSLHQAHHRHGSRPYYRLELTSDSPRAPAGYVILMFAALVPSVWRRVMTPPLAHWRAQPGSPRSSGRRLACVAYYR